MIALKKKMLSRNKLLCIEGMILEEETFEAFGHYPSELPPQSNKSVLAACEVCGEFRVNRKLDYRTFCRSCSNILSGKHKDLEHTEKTKAALSARMLGKKHTKEHNAKISAATKGKNNPNYKGGLIKCICLWCGKDFEVKQHRIKDGGGKYCCLSCVAKARIHNLHPKLTAPEKAFKSICVKNDLPFKFVGDGSLYLGRANPDFVHNTKNIVVEVFGDYWHSPLLNRSLRYTATVPGRRKQLKAEGYKCIFIWETDLKRKDADAHVMYLMRKEGII